MTTLTIRGVSDEAKAELRVEAARHGRSMEAELRARIEEWYGRQSAETCLGTRAHQAFLDAFSDESEAEQAAQEYAAAMEEIQAERRRAMPREIDFGAVE